MASFTPSGVEFVAKGLSGYLGDLNKANDAQQALGKSVAGIGSSFTSAQSGVASFASTVGGSTGAISGFVSSLGQMAIVAGGNILASAFESIAGGVRDFASAGLEAVSHAQTLEASLGALLVQNNLYTQTTESMSVAVGNLAEMQAEAAAKSDDLAFKQRELTADINTQNASIQEQRQRIMQMADGLDKNQQVARLQEMEIALEGMNRELADTAIEQGKLNNITQEYTTVTKTSWQQVMDMTTAQSLAKEQTKELLGFIEKLAIVSPFEQEDVEKVTQYAIGAGLGVEATEDFTAGFLDLAAAVGITSPNLDEAAYQLLQVKKAGKLTAIDLRQLSTRGIDLAKIIGIQMGMSVDEFNDKAEKTPAIFDDLIQAVTDYSKNTFAGTSEAMSTSIEGFRSTVSDLFTQSAKKVLRPLVDAVTPTVAEMISVAADFITGGQAEQIGQMLADGVMTGFATISEGITKVFGAFQRFGAGGAAISLMGMLGFSPESITMVSTTIDSIIEQVGRIQAAFSQFGLSGAAFSIGGLLGLDSDTMVTIQQAIDSIITAVTNFGNILMGISFEEWTGGLAGVAAVLGGGVLASLIVGVATAIAGLVTPIGLLAAGVGVLGMAWAGNWGNIQGITSTVITYVVEQVTNLVAVLTPAFNSIWASLTQLGEAFSSTGVSSDTLMTTLGAIGTFIVSVAIPAFVQFVGILAGTLAQAIQGIVDGMLLGHQAFVTVSNYITGTVIPTFLSMNDGISVVVDLLESIGNVMFAVTNKAIEAMAMIWQRSLAPALEKVGGFLKNLIMPAFTSLGDTVRSDVSPGLRELSETVIPLLQKGIEFVNEAIQRTISYFNSLAETINSVSLPDWIQMHSPPPLAQALTMSADAASLATKGLANMQRQMITSSGAAHDFVDSLDMGGIATELGGHGTAWKNWRRILKQNIGANMGALAEGMTPGEILGQVGNIAAQWRLPPGVVTDLAQANGLVEHLTDTFAVFQRQMRIENLGNMTQMAGSFSSLGSSFADMLTNMMAGGEAAKKTATDYRKLTETLGGQESQLAILKEELALLVAAEEQDTSAIKQKEKAIDDLTKSMDKNRESLLKTAEGYKQLQSQAFDLFSGNQNESQRIESELATIALLQDFLASGAESFLIPADAVSQAAGITGILYDQISGQQELNRLLAEQAEREELITRQKEAQQKLDFLKSQLDLIKLGESLGGDIFQGITFGLDASVEDLLAATNAVVEAMVGQIDADLQLGSPSRLMMSMFGDAMAGATLGVQKGAGALEYAFNASLSPFLNAGKMLAPSTNSYGNTNNNYFNMNVNTGANASAVIRQYEVARSTL